MPFDTSAKLSVIINGIAYEQASVVTTTSQEIANPSVPAARSGTLTTRTDNDTATLTMLAGHGFVTNDVVDVYWSGGSRRGMTATVTVNSVVVDGGAGDNLPPATTEITAMKPVVVPMAVVGNDVRAIATSCQSNVAGRVVFKAANGSVITSYSIPVGVRSQVWANGLGITNPLAGATVATVEFSHGATTAQEMTAAVTF